MSSPLPLPEYGDDAGANNLVQLPLPPLPPYTPQTLYGDDAGANNLVQLPLPPLPPYTPQTLPPLPFIRFLLTTRNGASAG